MFFVESETNSALPDRIFFIEMNALNNLLNSFCYRAFNSSLSQDKIEVSPWEVWTDRQTKRWTSVISGSQPNVIKTVSYLSSLESPSY